MVERGAKGRAQYKKKIGICCIRQETVSALGWRIGKPSREDLRRLSFGLDWTQAELLIPL